MKKVIIIGAGIGGLSLAAMLGKQGYQVTVLEKNEIVGGRASVFSEAGFTFDMGPSWYLMPDVFAHWFSLMGERVEDWLNLHRLSPSYRIIFKNAPEERRVIDIFGDLAKDIPTLERLEPGSGNAFMRYLDRAKEGYEIAKEEFMYKNYDSFLDFLTPRMAVGGIKLSVFTPMHTYVQRFFKTDEVQKIMEYTLVFLGGSPYNTPALYSIMTYIDFGMGVFYPMGGIYKIIEALKGIGEKHGVTYECNAEVVEILTKDGKVQGVKLHNGKELFADIVVSNADIAHTEMSLLKKPEDRTKSEVYWDKRTLAPSALLIYLGVKGELSELQHHTLIFSQDWKKNFAEIFDHPRWPSNPSLYVCASSKTDPSVAPVGDENIFMLVPIAPDLAYTHEELEQYTNRVIAEIAKEIHAPDLAERIVVKRTFCVKDFASRYNAHKGTALGLAHTLTQTAIFRPNTVSKKVKNLYYVGGDTNPGIGMPICLISAELVYKRLIGDSSAQPLKQL